MHNDGSMENGAWLLAYGAWPTGTRDSQEFTTCEGRRRESRIVVLCRAMATKPAKAKTSPEKQLNGFIEKYTPEIATLVKAARGKMQAFLPGAVELVYDNFNALAIGFGPSERASEA